MQTSTGVSLIRCLGIIAVIGFLTSQQGCASPTSSSDEQPGVVRPKITDTGAVKPIPPSPDSNAVKHLPPSPDSNAVNTDSTGVSR